MAYSLVRHFLVLLTLSVSLALGFYMSCGKDTMLTLLASIRFDESKTGHKGILEQARKAENKKTHQIKTHSYICQANMLYLVNAI